MDIVYVYPPLFKPFYPMATRIITENMLRDGHLNVRFSEIPIRTYLSKIHRELYDKIMKRVISESPPNVAAFVGQKYMENSLFYVFMIHGYFDEFIYEEPDEEYVVLTCINFCDLLMVRDLLEQNKKVLLGGPLVNIGLSQQFIREFLARMGVQAQKLRDNLAVVLGNIDLTTDLHALIRKWQDSTISSNDYSTIYACERDFLQCFYPDSMKIPVHFGLHNHCWHGKCKFCTYRYLPKMDFLKHSHVPEMVRYTHAVMEKFHSRQLRFIDSYYSTNNPKVQDYLSQVNGYNITIYTGIHLLKKAEYIRFINGFADCLLIGLETTSDFSLKHIDKGYTYQDVQDAVENIIRYLDPHIFLEISIIVDLPHKDREDVRLNYENILKLKETLENAGFKVAVHMNILSVFPNLELLATEDSLLKASHREEDIQTSSGKNYLVHILRKAGMDQPLQLPGGIIRDRNGTDDFHYGYISTDVPVVRYDANGNVLPSDLEIVDEEIMKGILIRKTSRFQ
jgi:hypothetical protein